MQLQCNLLAFLHKINDFQQNTLEIEPQVKCSCIAAAFLAGNLHFFEFPRCLPKMQLQCSCNPIYLHVCIKSMIFSKNTFNIQCRCIAAAFLAGNLQFFKFPRGLPKMQLQCSKNAAAMQLQPPRMQLQCSCSCNAAAASQNAPAMFPKCTQCACSAPFLKRKKPRGSLS